MNIDAWADFGEQLVYSNDLSYFPDEWTFPYSLDERFVDFVKIYLEDYGLKKLREYNLSDKTLKEYTGFLTLPFGRVKIQGRDYLGQNIFLEKGKIRYLQNENYFEDWILKEQFFLKEDGFLYKEFKDLKEDLY